MAWCQPVTEFFDMIVTEEMKAKIIADYNAMKTSGEKAAYARRLKKAGLPVPASGGPKHAKQDALIAALLAMGTKAEPVKKAA